MKKEIKILIIDNRPMVIQGIKSTLNVNGFISQKVKVDISRNFYSSMRNLTEKSQKKIFYDVIILDVDIEMNKNNIVHYQELELMTLKQICPCTKFVMLIRNLDNYRIYNISKKIQPDAFLLEIELDYKNLKLIFQNILKGKQYYSNKITRVIQKDQYDALELDDIDRDILYYLSKGVKTKDLTKYISKSLSTIEKRKQKLKQQLAFSECSEEKLIEEALSKHVI